MKIPLICSLLSGALLAGTGSVAAQDSGQIEQLQRQIQRLQEDFEKQQALQRQQIEALKQQIEHLQHAPTTNVVATAAPPESAAVPAIIPSKGVSLAEPIRVAGGGKTYLNLSLDGLFAAGTSTANDIERLQPGGHDPTQRGFTLQNLEATFDGAVDPYFRGQANLVFQIDSAGESHVEVEEAYLTTVSLPANLQVKAGQFFTEFGRLNPSHPHTWSFVDQPLVNSRFFGPDGLRNPGARISWLIPTPFYSELFLTMQDSQGATAYSFRDDHGGDLLFGRPSRMGRTASLGDMLFAPRYVSSFDLTDTQTLMLGASGAFGANGSGSDARTEGYGVDLFWKWKPASQNGGFPFVSWQSEGMVRRFKAGAYDGLLDPANPTPALPGETLLDYGFYSQLGWGFHKGWVAGLRGDYVTGDRAAFYPDPDRDSRWRVSPNLTWFPTEFSKIRLQYNYDDRLNIGVDHSVWLQFEFLMGAHAAHKF